ncbi:MAG TPA: aminotransferase class I/II-fold pyridoxal phosphate-dependent enzyme [Gemmatimonadaceae bacterium]|nr:aminotransferase class I/II-fold pyridoxal phosphate-dependent enzyme [Gemmatimonadaceae bacterium]
MPVSRRSFVATVGATLGAGATGLLSAPLVSWRGHEGLLAQQATQEPTSSGIDARRADRLLATRPGMIRIDSNENPNGPGKRALDAITRHLSESNRYPVKDEDDVIQLLAKVHGLKAENFVLGCGSGELLRAAVYAFTSASRALVAPEPTFEAPANFAKFLNHPVNAPKVDAKLSLDLDAMTDAARGAGLVYFCNPNNPTAAVHGKSDVGAYVDGVMRASPDTTILIDEAYHEYVADPNYRTAIPLALANPRVVVTRTFSKVFGMAGLRAGYAVGRPETLKKMSAWLLGSNVNQLALVAAATTVGDTTHIADEVRRNREARAFTRSFFEKAGYAVHASEANFMMVDIRRDAKAFKLECVKHNVAIGRFFPALPNYARISVGTMPEMTKAVAVFHSVLATQVSSSH